MTRDLIRGRPVTMSDFRLTEQPFPAGIASGRHLGKPGAADGPLWVDSGGSIAVLGTAGIGASRPLPRVPAKVR